MSCVCVCMCVCVVSVCMRMHVCLCMYHVTYIYMRVYVCVCLLVCVECYFHQSLFFIILQCACELKGFIVDLWVLFNSNSSLCPSSNSPNKTNFCILLFCDLKTRRPGMKLISLLFYSIFYFARACRLSFV